MDNDQDKEEEEQDEDKQKTYSPCSRCHEAFPNSFLLRRHMLDNHWEELKQKNMLFLHEYKYRVKNIFCDYEGCERYIKCFNCINSKYTFPLSATLEIKLTRRTMLIKYIPRKRVFSVISVPRLITALIPFIATR